ncbi:RNA-dependent ATPase rok1 [Dimargaris xerosporica]|nr:RNA-dependent ATPase rok1 [Dimargaris xerosporica]
MDFFKLLGQGARFNHQRREKELDLLKTNANKPTAKQTSTLGAPLDPTLDFFGNSTAIPAAKPKTLPASGDDSETDQPDSTNSNPLSTDASDDEADATEPFATLDQVHAFREKHRIEVTHEDPPVYPIKSFDMLFDQYRFSNLLRTNVSKIKFSTPTPVQMQAIPITLAQQDLVTCAPTGSGKTLAFALPILHCLRRHEKVGFRALIISPTRELAQQIYTLFQQLTVGSKLQICLLTKMRGGDAAKDGAAMLKKYDILITTPLRLVGELKHETIDLRNVEHLVLDEADQLLDEGFLEQVDAIVAACSRSSIRKSLYSATMPEGVVQLADSIMRAPAQLHIGVRNAATETIDQKLVYVGDEAGKVIEIRQMIQRGFRPPALIFVQSIVRAKDLYYELLYDGINVDIIHSGKTQAQRENVVRGFRQGEIWVLISTELMSRGIDFKGVNLVINYDFPQTAESYIHRIGRTGRAGRAGQAITFYTKHDVTYLRNIVDVVRRSGCKVSDWMLQLEAPTEAQLKKVASRPIKRDSIAVRPGSGKRSSEGGSKETKPAKRIKKAATPKAQRPKKPKTKLKPRKSSKPSLTEEAN